MGSKPEFRALWFLFLRNPDQHTKLCMMWLSKEDPDSLCCPGKESTLKTPGFLKKALGNWV